MPTHAAVATVGIKKPLEIIQVPTIPPKDDEVLVRVEWTASTPLDMHQNDGGLLVKHPQVLGDGTAGVVVGVGNAVKRLRLGDKVFGFTWREQKEKAHQEFSTAPEWLFALLPEGFTLAEAVTLPNNFVTVFHAFTRDLGIATPWPKPYNYSPPDHEQAILIWGGSSSVGQFAIQILRYYGYTTILCTASERHHSRLQSLGAKFTFDYSDPNVVSDILNTIAVQSVPAGHIGVPLILDCIGSLEGSIKPIAKIAKGHCRVAILLPVIERDSSETETPIYEMDVSHGVSWDEGVDVRGVRTHSYLDNEFFKHHLQPDIMYALLKDHVVQPNNQKLIEGATLLERANKAMNALRRKEASGERLVWRVSDAGAA